MIFPRKKIYFIKGHIYNFMNIKILFFIACFGGMYLFITILSEKIITEFIISNFMYKLKSFTFKFLFVRDTIH